MRNQVQRNSSYPSERNIGLHNCITQSGEGQERKRNAVEKESKRQTACEKSSIVLIKFSECSRDDFEQGFWGKERYCKGSVFSSGASIPFTLSSVAGSGPRPAAKALSLVRPPASNPGRPQLPSWHRGTDE